MKKIMTITFALSFMAAQAQENLVPNFDFNNTVKKVKMEGQIKYAEPWTSPTLAPADLDRKSVVQGKSVDLGGRRIIKKKKK